MRLILQTLGRILRITFRLFLLLVVLAAGALAVLTLTPPGRESLAGMISTMASTDTRKVTIGGLSGIWSGNLSLDHVVVEDTEGPWLVARGIKATWSPSALLSSTLRADLVHADRIEVARLPKPEPSEDPSEPFSLPVDIDVAKIDLPVIALGGEIAGEVAEISADGSLTANAEPLTVKTSLNLARRDGKEGTLTAAIDFAPNENRLDIDIKGIEPAGGVIANLLRLPDTPPVEVAIKGSGPASNWKGEGTFSVAGTVITTLSGSHQVTDRGRRIEAKGDGLFDAFVPGVAKPLLTGPTTFDLAAILLNEGGIDIERADIVSATAQISATGQYNPTEATNLAINLTTPAGPVRLTLGSEADPVAIDLERLALRAFGAGTAPALDASVTATAVSTRMVEIAGLDASVHSDGFDLGSLTGPVTIDARAASAGSPDQTIASLLAGAVTAHLEATISETDIAIATGTIRSDSQTSTVSGTVARDGSTIALDVGADLLSAVLPPAARPVLAERTALSAKVARDAEGGITADALSVTSGDFSAKGSASLKGETIDASVQGALAEIGKLADGTSGAIAFDIKANGPLSAPNLNLTVSSEKFTAAGRDITNLELTARGVANLAAPAAEVAIKGSVAGQPLTGSATLKTVEGRREISGLALSLGQNRIAGDLALDAAFLPQGTIDVALPDLGPLAALALEEIEGELNGKIRFGVANGVPEVIIDATTALLKRQDLTASGVSVGASIQNYLVRPTISGKVTAATVAVGGTNILGIDLTLGRDGDWTTFNGGATVADIPAKASGRARFADGTVTVELATGEATVRGLAAKLASPTTIVSQNGVLKLDRLALSVGGGRVQVTGEAGSTLNLDVEVSAMPASVVNSFAPGLGASGTMSGTARLTGAAANPTVGYTIDWRNAQTTQTTSAGFGAMTVASSGTLANGRLQLTANAGDSSGLGLKGGGEVLITGTRTLALDFSGSVPFGFLTRRLAAQGLALSGGAQVSLTVRGPLGSPDVGGTIRSSGARFIDSRSGIAVNDLGIEVRLAGGVANVTRLTGALSSGGTVNGSGTIGINAGQGFPADLTIRIVDGRYTDGQIVTTTLNGELAVKGPLTSLPVLSGTVNLGKTVIQVPERLPTSIATLDVQHKNAPATVQQQDRALKPAQSGNGSSGGIGLDLTVNAPQQIFIQGRGLDAELGGSVRLTGSAAAPSAVGQFTLRRGRLSLLGKRLAFTRGSLGFSGSLVPYLDFAAEQSATDATVTVLITGPANNPKFNFQSVPALPEDEVLARLIFGRAMSNLSPLQIAQLADAAATLAGAAGTSSLLSTLRSKVGVDDLDVKTDEQGRAAVSVGKYLNDRTYVTIEKGEGAGTGKATIDLDVGRGVKLRGQATDGGEAKGGIFYEREY